jgi:modulator of FtsH protease HflK
MHRADKRSEIAALIGLALQIIFFGLYLVLFNINQSPATLAESWYLLAGVGIWLLVFIELYQQRAAWQQRVELEEFERQRLQRLGGSESVFQQFNPDEELPAERRLKFIKRWVVPFLALVTAGVLLLFSALLIPSWRPMTWVKDAFESTVRNQFATLAIIAVTSLSCFVFSRYCLGLSRTSGWWVLRAGANYLMGSAIISFALAITLAFSVYGSPRPERILAYAIPILMGLLGFEIIINLILDIYRPRIPGEEYRASYESRLLGLFCEPEGVLHSIAQAIDYQFGFKVSETWFYQLLQQAVIPLVLFGAVTLYAMSTIVIVEPGQQALITHFGKKPVAPLTEGPHLKWPWPIDKASVYDVDKVMQMIIGFSGESAWLEAKDLNRPETLKPILWTVQHVKNGAEFQLLVASRNRAETQAEPAQSKKKDIQSRLTPVNILSGELVISYKVKITKDGKGLLEYVGNYLDPDGPTGGQQPLLEAVAYRQWTQYMASVDPMAIMTTDREKATESLKKSMQEELDRQKSGLEILQISMVGMHPPLDTASAFESAVNARQERETMIWRAQGKANERLPEAQAFAGETLAKARSERYGKLEVEKAKAQRFEAQLASYKIAPDVFFLRNYLDVLIQSTGNVRKYILAVEHPEKAMLIIDDKEKISSGLMGLGEEVAKEAQNKQE